ncbi:MAG TPA: nucleotide exchange factor GrpE [Alphaproteobacteria bacterium]|jgi:molecular chaperone GrpE|nr:nucleotide exchange factor GrpE [Alphaproteobacteria bacterium]
MTDDDKKKHEPEAPANDTEPVAAGAAAAEPAEADKVAELEADLAEARDRMLRAMAETENVRRRLEREREDTARYAISRFAGDMLTVADNLRRALDAVPAQAIEKDEFLARLVNGVGATEKTLLSALEKNGVKKLDPAGQKFDPNFHEVLFEIDAPDQPVGTVVQVLEAGYTIGDRLLRPARVAAAKGGPAA